MGFASASREEKLKMMKTSNSRKTTRKLNKLGKNKKIARHVIDDFKDIKARRSKESRKRATNIEDDWVVDREVQDLNQETEDALPLDMLDADIDWENSAFAGLKRRLDQRLAENDEELDGEDFESKRRKFDGQLGDDEEEMLPIKLEDGTLIRPTRQKAQQDEDSEEEDEEEEQKATQEDYSSLSATQLLAKRKELIEEHKINISSACNNLLGNPQDNIYKLRDLYHLCQGKGVHSLVRETVQKLAIASMVQVLIDIIPGYSIRPLTDEERQQKQKKETKKLYMFEESLLRYHLKFLQLCEKFAKKFEGKNKQVAEDTFTYKIGMLSIKALCRIMNSCSHFNYTTNIISALVRLSLCSSKTVVAEVCGALSTLFKNDVYLKMSLFGARSISTIVAKLKGRVNPELLETLLNMNIREVKNEDKKSGKTRIFAQRARVKKERANKSAKKYRKQLDKLESDLKELDAAELLTTKLKIATQTIKYVFQIYFSVLRRMPTLSLLQPCLEGLSKFAHLLGVEYFDDIIRTMEDLVDKQHLRLIDQIYCINTVFVILSGDGQLLNVDPSKFYRSIYRILNSLPFETKPEQRLKQITMTAKTLDLMMNERRKQVPLGRAAAFTKRLLSIATVMDDPAAVCILSLVRTFFIGLPKLVTLVEDDEGGCGAGGICRVDLDDPDVSNALGGNIILELRMLARRRNKVISKYAQNILNGVPSTGPSQLSPQLTTVKPWVLLEREITEQGEYEKVDMKYIKDIQTYCKKRGQDLSSKNIQFHISNWLESRPF